MAQLSESELEIIQANPIKDELKALLTTFKSTCSSAKIADSPAGYKSLLTDPVGKDLAFRLIGSLQLLPAASALPSKYGLGPLSGDIALLYSGLSSSQTNINSIAGLLHTVVAVDDDQRIWAKLYEVIAQTRPTPQPTTPPQTHPLIASSFQQTPLSFNTGGFEDTSEYRKQVDDLLREELLPSLRIDIPDFVDAVFGCVPRLEELAETIFRLCQEGDNPLYTQDGGWSKWHPSAKEELVLLWLQELVERLTVWVGEHSTGATASRQIYRGPGIYLDGTAIKRKMDVGITAGNGQGRINDSSANKNKDALKPNWSQILVTGELKSNPVEDGQEAAWIGLATYTREVFRKQYRRFVLGFTLCGSRMRLWHFDRSGSSGSTSFDINQDGLTFTRVMLGYYLMTDEQLGLDPTIQQSEGKQYVEITRDGQVERLILVALIKKQAAIIGRATTCWRAYRDIDKTKKPLIVKDSWQYKERPEEGLLIKEATNKGVENIARYYHHETVHVDGEIDDTLGSIRRGLMEGCGRTSFRQKASKTPEVFASESQETAVAGQIQLPLLLRKRSSSSAQLESQSSNRRPRSSFLTRDPAKPLHNRIHRRIVTRDAGKHISEAKSIGAIINGLLGAVHGHKSLLNAGILHRDISIGNIMLTENEDDGFLIDLDLAIKISDDRASGAPSRTGTKIFMSIGVLLGEPRSFMHDLESFFWVLFWICIHSSGFDKKGKAKRRITRFEDWNYLDTERLSREKAGQISYSIFRTVDKHFTEYCKPLIPCLRELHKVIFPSGGPQTEEDIQLYSQITAVLEKARKNLGKETS
ncbi:MAG: hypothetical protein Q9196_003371 [Gyalolechia fulgens]